jgi:IS30 family transposase
MARAIDWRQYDRLKAQGLADREIARRWGIPWSTFQRERQRHTEAHPRERLAYAQAMGEQLFKRVA